MQGRPPAPWTGPSGPQQAMPGPQSGYAGAFGQPPPLAPIAPGSIAGLFSSSIAAPRTGIAFQPTAAVAPVAAVAPNPLHCAPCDKTFVNAAQLATHAATHVQCSVCAFKAAKKVVSLHEEEIHGRIDVEVPPQYRVGKLDTPEEIAKWIEERKKNYPTEANVARKKEEAVKAGEKRKREQEELGPICNYFARGRCTRGDACKYRHERPANAPPEPFKSVFPPAPFAGPRGKRIPLLQALLERDVRKERALLLQCARYIVANNFFRGVEMPPPPAPEEPEERKMIEVISSVDNPEPPVEEQNEMDIVETAVSVVVEDREPAIKPNPAQPNKPAASLLPLADYGASDSEDSAAESSDDSDIEVQTHAFSLGGPIIKRKEREAPSTMDVPVADPDEEVDYELE